MPMRQAFGLGLRGAPFAVAPLFAEGRRVPALRVRERGLAFGFDAAVVFTGAGSVSAGSALGCAGGMSVSATGALSLRSRAPVPPEPHAAKAAPPP